jgi:hypothetical protein
MGFVLMPEEAHRLLEKDPRNRDVLFPYLNGEDLNRRWDQSPSRWVINFRDWPVERAMEYPDCFEIVERLVKPERSKLATGDATARDRAKRWWQFTRPALNLYATIAGLERVLLCTRVSKYLNFVFVPNQSIFTLDVFVFAFRTAGHFAALQSGFHLAWVLGFPSTHETRMRYAASDVFETFPLPLDPLSLDSVGKSFHAHRGEIMATRREGLTATYNRFHSPHDVLEDIAHLRRLQIQMDYSIAVAYGWNDLNLDHDFHETKSGIRFTFSEAARREVLDRLLVLNHERYAQEQAVEQASRKAKPKARKRVHEQPGLF